MAYAFEYEGTEYVLEFDRASVELAERGLDLTIDEVRSQKVSSFKTLFHAALLKHHPRVKPHTVDRLYEVQDDKLGLHQDLVEMYGETINSLFDEVPEGKAVTRRKL